MPVVSESVSSPGSGLVFDNTYGVGVTDAYRSAILTAETYLQNHFSNSVTIRATFEMGPLDDGAAATNAFYGGIVSYQAFSSALRASATTADDQLAVNGLPIFDPSAGARFFVPLAELRALGYATSDVPFDVKVILGSEDVWSFGDDAVAAIVHELSEGAMGRIGTLGIAAPEWMPMDLFRFTATGVRDYTGGSDGVATFFGVDGAHVDTALQFHSSVSIAGVDDHEDLADWDDTSDDAFGPGGGGFFNQLSATDLKILDVLGWTPNARAGPVIPGDDFASSLTDSSHPFGQVAADGTVHAVLQAAGDRDWFAVQLAPGNYLISETGAGGAGGTLADPFLRVYDSTGALIREADDIIPGQNLDARLVIHIGIADTLYVEAGSRLDQGAGSYTIGVLAGAPAPTASADLLFGDITGSTISAGAGDDTIVGRDAANYLRGEDGNDLIQGGAQFDDINGNKGDDTIHGGEGDDWVVGGQGNDVLFGDDGWDIVYGNLGNDTCAAGSGDDWLRGGQGDDSLVGGSGANWISGDRGNDTEIGGAGADTFNGFSGIGTDKILDFNLAEGDRIQLDPGTAWTVSQVGADTVIDLGNGNRMILVGVQVSTLTPGWIFGF